MIRAIAELASAPIRDIIKSRWGTVAAMATEIQKSEHYLITGNILGGGNEDPTYMGYYDGNVEKKGDVRNRCCEGFRNSQEHMQYVRGHIINYRRGKPTC